MSVLTIVIISLPGISFVFGTAASMAGFYYFDLLLRIQFALHREEWQRDGCPIGFFWVPPAASLWAGSWARSELNREWASSCPRWVPVDEQAAQIYSKFKRVCRVGNAVTTVGLVIFALIFIWFITLLGQ